MKTVASKLVSWGIFAFPATQTALFAYYSDKHDKKQQNNMEQYVNDHPDCKIKTITQSLPGRHRFNNYPISYVVDKNGDKVDIDHHVHCAVLK